MNETTTSVTRFFDRYAAALLARDAAAVAKMYAVPSLIVFPGMVIAVSDASQTEQFFASTWDQYEGVQTLDKQIVIMAAAPASVWADVTWFHDGQPLERLCYQLIGDAGSYQIGVLTPLPLA